MSFSGTHVLNKKEDCQYGHYDHDWGKPHDQTPGFRHFEESPSGFLEHVTNCKVALDFLLAFAGNGFSKIELVHGFLHFKWATINSDPILRLWARKYIGESTYIGGIHHLFCR